MNEPLQNTTATQSDCEIARERTKQVSIAGWTGGCSALFAVGALSTNPTWPVAAGVAAVSVMIAIICIGILTRQ